jgi:hypothetical protein
MTMPSGETLITTVDGAVQLELPFDEPQEETNLPPDAPTTVPNCNAFFRAVILFPNYFGEEMYEIALNWFTLTNGEKKMKLITARKMRADTEEAKNV